jgi:hypothetical protein
MKLSMKVICWVVLFSLTTLTFVQVNAAMSKYSEGYLNSQIDFSNKSGVYLIGENHDFGIGLQSYYPTIAEMGSAVVLMEGHVDDNETMKSWSPEYPLNYKGLENMSFHKFFKAYWLLDNFLKEQQSGSSDVSRVHDAISILYHSYYHDEHFKFLVDQICETENMPNMFRHITYQDQLRKSTEKLVRLGVKPEAIKDQLLFFMNTDITEFCLDTPAYNAIFQKFMSKLALSLLNELQVPKAFFGHEKCAGYIREKWRNEIMTLGLLSNDKQTLYEYFVTKEEVRSDYMLFMMLKCRDHLFAERIESEYNLQQNSGNPLPIIVVMGAMHLNGVSDLLKKANIPHNIINLNAKDTVHDEL